MQSNSNESQVSHQTTTNINGNVANSSTPPSTSTNEPDFVHNYQIPPYAGPVLPGAYFAAMAAAAAAAAGGKPTIYTPTPNAYPYAIPHPVMNSVVDGGSHIVEPNLMTMQMPYPAGAGAPFVPHPASYVAYMPNQLSYDDTAATVPVNYDGRLTNDGSPSSNEPCVQPKSNGSKPSKYHRYYNGNKPNYQNGRYEKN